MKINPKINIRNSSFLSREWIVLILLWPLGALYFALKNFRNSQAKNVFWMFCVFMGMVFIYNPMGGSGADGVRYAENLIHLNKSPLSWGLFKQSFYDPSGGFLDLYQPIVTFLVSLVTGNPTILFIAFAFVFGFFYSRNMWFVLEKIPITLNFTSIILISTLFLIVPIWDINGVRMWTACHMFLFGTLPFIWNKDKSKIIWAFLSFLVHFSFIIPIVIIAIYYLLPKRYLFPFIAFFIVSLFVSELDMEKVRAIGQLLPEIFHRKVQGYTADPHVEEVESAQRSIGWLIFLINFINKWGVAAVLISIGLRDKSILKRNHSLRNLFLFSLFILSVSTIISNIPSGNRFVTVSRIVVFSFIILYYSFLRQTQIKTFSRKVIRIVTFFFIISLFIPIRTPSVFFGIDALTNPVIAIFSENRESFYYLLKGR